jgi:hypothetical protein
MFAQDLIYMNNKSKFVLEQEVDDCIGSLRNSQSKFFVINVLWYCSK